MRSAVCICFASLLLCAVGARSQPREEDRRYNLAQGYERSGDLKNASRVYRELFDSDTNSSLYFEAVRRTYAALGRFHELLPLIETRIARQPNDYNLQVAYADVLFRVGRRDEARVAWRRALEIGAYQEFVYAIVAESQTDNRAYDAAIETYRASRERLGDRYMFTDQLAYLYGIVGRYDDAMHEYLIMLGVAPERLSIVKRAIAQLTSNPTALAAATQVVERAVQRNSDFEPTLELLSWLYDEAGNHTGAFEVAKRLDHVRNARGSNVYAYADRALRDGRYDAALMALDYFIATYRADNPLYSIVLLTYARALEDRQMATGARTSSQSATLVERYTDLADRERGTEVAAEALLRAAHLQADVLDASDEAVATLQTLLAAPKNERVLSDARVLLGDLYVRENRLDDALEQYDGAATAAGADEDERAVARLRRAELALYRGAFKDAVDSLTELTRNTASAVTNDALAHLFILQENFGRKDIALGHYYAGRLLLVQRKWEDAVIRFDQTSSAAPGSLLAEESTLAKADALSRDGESRSAVEILVAFVAASPDALSADRALYRAAQIVDTELQDSSRALELYSRLLIEYPRSQHAAAARARVRLLRNG